MLAGNANRIADGEPPLEPSQPDAAADMLTQPMALARIHQYLSMAMPLLWTRQPDTFGVARPRAQRERRARTATPARSSTGSASCSTAARDLWRTLPEVEDDGRARLVARTTPSGSSTSPTSWR